MSISKEDIINSISNMSVIELVELVKAIEKKFDLPANSGFFNTLAPANTSEKEVAKEEEQSIFSVIMSGYGDDKLNIIKKVRSILNLGLKESKEFVENLPAVIKKDIPKVEAEILKKDFEALGAKIDLK